MTKINKFPFRICFHENNFYSDEKEEWIRFTDSMLLANSHRHPPLFMFGNDDDILYIWVSLSRSPASLFMSKARVASGSRIAWLFLLLTDERASDKTQMSQNDQRLWNWIAHVIRNFWRGKYFHSSCFEDFLSLLVINWCQYSIIKGLRTNAWSHPQFPYFCGNNFLYWK